MARSGEEKRDSVGTHRFAGLSAETIAETVKGFAPQYAPPANANWIMTEIAAPVRSEFLCARHANNRLFTTSCINGYRGRQKRREDASALPKLSRKGKEPSGLVLHEVLSECDASAHRFYCYRCAFSNCFLT